MRKIGRPAEPVLFRIISKLEIDHRPASNFHLENLVGYPVEVWPEELRNLPWVWTGGVSSKAKTLTHTPSYSKSAFTLTGGKCIPGIRYGNKTVNPRNILYEMMIEPLPPKFRMVYYSKPSLPFDLNPTHWHPRESVKYPYVKGDFSDTSIPTPVGELEDLADLLTGAFSLKRFHSLKEIFEHFKGDIDDVSEEVLLEALKHANLTLHD